MRADALNNELGSISGTFPVGTAKAIDATPSITSRTATKFFIWFYAPKFDPDKSVILLIFEPILDGMAAYVSSQ
jgi:hypothetical protein